MCAVRSIQTYEVPIFPSADDDERADDDADESDADSNSDPCHRLLIQVVEAIRKSCEGWSNIEYQSFGKFAVGEKFVLVTGKPQMWVMKWFCQDDVDITDLWSGWSLEDHDQRINLLGLLTLLYEKTAHRPSCWMQKLSQSKSGQASASPAVTWWWFLLETLTLVFNCTLTAHWERKSRERIRFEFP